MCGCVSAASVGRDQEEPGDGQPEVKAAPPKPVETPKEEKEEPPPKKKHVPPPFSLPGLLRALAGTFRIDKNQLESVAHWWRAVGLEDEPREPQEVVQLLFQGDGSALGLLVSAPIERGLAAVPNLLSILPDNMLSPPPAAPPGDRVIAPAPPRAFSPEVLLGALEPQSLPTEISDGILARTEVRDARPKAKAKVKVKGNSTSASSAPETKTMPVAPATPFPTDDVLSDEYGNSPPIQQKPAPDVLFDASGSDPKPVPAEMPPVSQDRVSLSPPIASALRAPDESSRVGSKAVKFHTEPHEDVKEIEIDTDIQDDDLDETDTGEETMASLPPQRRLPALDGSDMLSGKLPRETSELTEGSTDMQAADVAATAQGWQRALRNVANVLNSTHVQIWMHLGGFGLPQEVRREAAIGVRLLAAEPGCSLSVTTGYDDVVDTLESVGISTESDWGVTEMGCSFFSDGPSASFSIRNDDPESKGEMCDELVDSVIPAPLKRSVQSLAANPQVCTRVRIDVKGGLPLLGLQFKRLVEKRKLKHSITSDLQSMAFDFAMTKERKGRAPPGVFDAFLLERFRQMITSVGGTSEVTGIEFRLDDSALITLSVSPVFPETTPPPRGKPETAVGPQASE